MPNCWCGAEADSDLMTLPSENTELVTCPLPDGNRGSESGGVDTAWAVFTAGVGRTVGPAPKMPEARPLGL